MNKATNSMLKSGPGILSMLITASIGLSPLAASAKTVNMHAAGKHEQITKQTTNKPGKGHGWPGNRDHDWPHGWTDKIPGNPHFDQFIPGLPGNPPAFTRPGSDLGVGAVPVPAAVWLFGSGLVGLIGMARRRKP